MIPEEVIKMKTSFKISFENGNEKIVSESQRLDAIEIAELSGQKYKVTEVSTPTREEVINFITVAATHTYDKLSDDLKADDLNIIISATAKLAIRNFDPTKISVFDACDDIIKQYALKARLVYLQEIQDELNKTRNNIMTEIEKLDEKDEELY
jgi:hypothetical protein